jgi:hypothetical protein
VIDVKTWITGKLKANAALLALLGGGADRIVDQYGKLPQTMPFITVREEWQFDTEGTFADDAPQSYDSVIEIIPNTRRDINTTALCTAIDTVMHANQFVNLFSGEISDPMGDVRRRLMRYRRQGLTSADLI